MLRISAEQTRNLRLQSAGVEIIQEGQSRWGAIAKFRRVLPALALLSLVISNASYAEEMRLEEGPALAFGRYIASIEERNPFTEAGPTQLEIDASLPALEKSGRLLAIRETDSSERSQYRAIEFTGDPTIKREVIARYLAAEREGEDLPYSSVAITPANYKFRYVGSVQSAGTTAYVFKITPRKKRLGLLEGQIWIDSETGIPIRQTGRFVKRPSVFVRRIYIVRDIEVREGKPSARTTNVTIDTRIVGTAKLSVTERPLKVIEAELEQ